MELNSVASKRNKCSILAFNMQCQKQIVILQIDVRNEILMASRLVLCRIHQFSTATKRTKSVFRFFFTVAVLVFFISRSTVAVWHVK